MAASQQPELTDAWKQHMQRSRLAFLLAMGFSLAFYFAMLALNVPNDIPVHAEDVARMTSGGDWPGHFLYFLLVALLSGWSSNMWVLLVVSYTLVATSVAIKLSITGHFVGNRLKMELARWQWWVAGALVVAFAIPVSWPEVYLGVIPPNMWHNSTTIFAMPFVLALFWQGLRYLDSPSNRLMGWMTLMVVINVLAKPNFFLCFAVVFPLLSLVQFRLSAHFWKSLVPVVLGGVVVVLEALVFFPEAGNDAASGTGVEASIKLAPFHVWAHHASNIPLAFLGSVAFPLAAVILFAKTLLRDRAFQLAAGVFLVALAQFILLSETGVREFHGNFGWGAIIGNYLLFVATLTAWMNQLPQRDAWTWKDRTVGGLFALHVLAGIGYMTKILGYGSYF